MQLYAWGQLLRSCLLQTILALAGWEGWLAGRGAGGRGVGVAAMVGDGSGRVGGVGWLGLRRAGWGRGWYERSYNQKGFLYG